VQSRSTTSLWNKQDPTAQTTEKKKGGANFICTTALFEKRGGVVRKSASDKKDPKQRYIMRKEKKLRYGDLNKRHRITGNQGRGLEKRSSKNSKKPTKEGGLGQ